MTGIVPSKDQGTRLDSLETQVPGWFVADDVWKEYVQKIRAVLLPPQQQIFDVNVTIDSLWTQYFKVFWQLFGNQASPRVVLAKWRFYAWHDYYSALGDSLQGVPQTPAQIQHRWETTRQGLRSILTPAELQQLDQQLDRFSSVAVSLAAIHINDPQRLFAGIVLSTSQRTQLGLQSQAAGVPDSLWPHALQVLRAALTPTQQPVFDVNVTVDATWQKYATAFERLAQTKEGPWDEAMRAFFLRQWAHYGAASESLHTVTQTPAQLQHRWETDRQAMRDSLKEGERRQLDSFLR